MERQKTNHKAHPNDEMRHEDEAGINKMMLNMSGWIHVLLSRGRRC